MTPEQLAQYAYAMLAGDGEGFPSNPREIERNAFLAGYKIAASALAAIRQEGVRSYPVVERSARSVDEAKALRLLLTDLKVASAVVEADWATAEFGEKFSDSPAYAHWNACIDAASGYLAKDGPAPINEAAPPTDRAGPSATDYDPILPSTPPPDRGADVETVRALFLTYDRANDAAWSEDGKLALVENPSRKHRDVVRDAFNKAKDEREVFLAALDRLAAPGWRPDREAIGKIIDPLGWAETPPEHVAFVFPYTWEQDRLSHRFTALAKADAILALKPPPPTDEM